MTTHVTFLPDYSGMAEPRTLRCPIVFHGVEPSNPWNPRNSCGRWWPVLRGACGTTVTLRRPGYATQAEATLEGERIAERERHGGL